MRIFLALLTLCLTLAAAAPCNAEPFEFTLMNDVMRPENKDRFLTNSASIKVGAWRIGNDMYSPRDKRSEEIDTGDRPWDGYSYIEHEGIESLAFGQEFRLRTRLGMVGKNSGSEAMQKFVHNDLGMGVPPTWAGQNPSEATIDVIASKRTREYIQSLFGDSALTQEYGGRAGNVNISLFLDQELRKHFFKSLYFYAGLRGDIVAYNTHLNGRMFHDNSYTVDPQWFVASGRAGIEYYSPSWNHYFISYGYVYLTEEFKGQEGRHSYGVLTLGKRF
jgi:lipid A 3-O-deacylase